MSKDEPVEALKEEQKVSWIEIKTRKSRETLESPLEKMDLPEPE